MTAESRERGRRLRIRLAALNRHKEARGPDGRSELAVAAGKASGLKREGDKAWALGMARERPPSTNWNYLTGAVPVPQHQQASLRALYGRDIPSYAIDSDRH